MIYTNFPTNSPVTNLVHSLGFHTTIEISNSRSSFLASCRRVLLQAQYITNEYIDEERDNKQERARERLTNRRWDVRKSGYEAKKRGPLLILFLVLHLLKQCSRLYFLLQYPLIRHYHFHCISVRIIVFELLFHCIWDYGTFCEIKWSLWTHPFKIKSNLEVKGFIHMRSFQISNCGENH